MAALLDTASRLGDLRPRMVRSARLLRRSIAIGLLAITGLFASPGVFGGALLLGATVHGHGHLLSWRADAGHVDLRFAHEPDAAPTPECEGGDDALARAGCCGVDPAPAPAADDHHGHTVHVVSAGSSHGLRTAGALHAAAAALAAPQLLLAAAPAAPPPAEDFAPPARSPASLASLRTTVLRI